jgi:hypothetical protein
MLLLQRTLGRAKGEFNLAKYILTLSSTVVHGSLEQTSGIWIVKKKPFFLYDDFNSCTLYISLISELKEAKNLQEVLVFRI